MTCTAQRGPLAAATAALARLSSDRRVRLRMAGGFLLLAATDGRTWLHLSVEAKGELAETCVSGSRLHEAVCSLGADLIGFQVDGAALRIFGGKGKRSLPINSTEGFPDPEFDGPLVLQINAERLREVLSFTLPHIPKEDDLAKTAMAGVFLFTEDGTIKAIGTDRNELSLIEVAETARPVELTIPGRLAELAARLVWGDVEISASERSMEFRWLGGVIRGQLLEAPFPTAQMVKAASVNIAIGGFPVSVEGKLLQDALHGVRGLGEEDKGSGGKRVAMILNGSARLSSSSNDGAADEEFKADLSEAEDLTIGFSSSRLDRVLKGFGDRVLTMTLKDPSSPIRFEAAGLPDRVALLFPMRI